MLRWSVSIFGVYFILDKVREKPKARNEQKSEVPSNGPNNISNDKTF